MLSDKVKVASLAKYGDSYCRTIIAIDTIEEGEPVWWYDPSGGSEQETFYTWSDIANEPDAARREALKTYSYMVNIDTYASTADPETDPSWFFNHSCDGNTFYRGDKAVVARRRILAGEEVSYDYALTETEASFHAGMQCMCGSAACRGALRFDDYRQPAFWREYQGHTTAHIARRGQECGWLDGRLAVRRAAAHDHAGGTQHGVFALHPIAKGQVVAVFGGRTLSQRDAALLEAATPGYPYLLQVDTKLWQVPFKMDTPDAPDFINHSCEANCGMADSTQVIAISDVPAGAELTLDYALINDGASPWPSDNFSCGCGARGCRKGVTSRDWELPAVQNRYWPHFSPFVRRLVAARRPELAAPQLLKSKAGKAASPAVIAVAAAALAGHGPELMVGVAQVGCS